MIKHFGNLQTPLQSIKRYPNLGDQERRFRDAGWSSATARSLWDLWSDSSFISSAQKTALNAIEPFDEWEEFSLFASHYFFLVAVQSSGLNTGSDRKHSNLTFSNYAFIPPRLSLQHKPQLQSLGGFDMNSEPGGQRRLGAVLPISQHAIGYHGGLGGQGRLNSTDVYKSGAAQPVKANLPPLAIEPRMCHTITILGEDRSLLVGGRASPYRAMSDCWLYSDATWERVSDAPAPLYRHCAAALSVDATHQGVLIYGGKSIDGQVANEWYVWNLIRGWAKVKVLGPQIKPRFGAVMESTDRRRGVLLGGMGEDGIVLAEVWKWSISDFETDPKIELTIGDEMIDPSTGNLSVICRFGACLTRSPAGLFLVGGISNQLLPQKHDIIELCPRRPSLDDHELLVRLIPSAIEMTTESHLPLLIGHSVFASKDLLIIVGGGAICFSFGAYWNQRIWTLRKIQPDNSDQKRLAWSLDRDQGFCISNTDHPALGSDSCDLILQSVTTTASVRSGEARTVKIVARGRVETAQAFDRVNDNCRPFIMEGLDLGSCVTEWTLDDLERKIGADRLVCRRRPISPLQKIACGWVFQLTTCCKVVVHEASNEHMDFQKKNFRYVTKPFGEFARQIRGGARQYLRSLAVKKPTTKPADLGSDFPELRPDFELPSQLSKVVQNAHSSPLRISGPVIMWLHYDACLSPYIPSFGLPKAHGMSV